MAADSSTQSAQPPAIDNRVRNLARIFDRLRPGTYHLKIIKDEIQSADWKIEIIRGELIQRVSLSNKNHVSE